MVGVDCYVKTTMQPNWFGPGESARPTFGGTLSADDTDFKCESCGQPLKLTWVVRIEEVATPPDTGTPREVSE